jgi:hypothetical protein
MSVDVSRLPRPALVSTSQAVPTLTRLANPPLHVPALSVPTALASPTRAPHLIPSRHTPTVL